MPSAFRTTRTRRALLALIAAVCAAGATRAEASCGDWLAGHTDTQSAELRPDPARPDLPAPTPCHGPSCRTRSDNSLPPAPAPVARPLIDQWACVSEDPRPAPATQRRDVVTARAVAAAGFWPLLERPPRPAA